jgi:Reverse transcriptase (RNA-dependent DNA polymerase)
MVRIDYRKLNAVTKKDAYPVPLIDEIFDHFGGSKIFTTLDAHSGDWQVEVDPADAEKTAFTSKYGIYEYTVIPFGLCNSPTFQRLMELVLDGLLWAIVVMTPVSSPEHSTIT